MGLSGGTTGVAKVALENGPWHSATMRRLKDVRKGAAAELVKGSHCRTIKGPATRVKGPGIRGKGLEERAQAVRRALYGFLK